ncbi:Replication protein A 32 kDa subunit [Habropoda laboriosa]|uniref:Replication protein A 32 kDa subunit n=1 Tax=Habropoda laboriosa TaxID=597456 RepID=A0A0L7R123_9HYME|nr:Replication protein A 32 kDa subunit [Habropoda laboriosa]
MWSSNLDTSASFEGGFLNNSRKGGQDDVKLRRVQTLIPVMIKHLLSASSTEETKFWNIPARMFIILGLVRNVEETATKISYDVEDQTVLFSLIFSFFVLIYLDHTVQINTYIRIIGLLREQNDKRHILILRMFPMQDLNELTNHILEVTYTALKAEAMAKTNKELENNPNVKVHEVPNEDSPYYGMTGDQTLVYKIIHAENDSESGIERSGIKAQVPKRILSEIDNILDFLVSEGHIYTTSTDNHFKTT